MNAEFWNAREFAAHLLINYKTALDALAAGDVPGAIRVGYQWRVHVATFLASLAQGGA